MSEEPGWYPDPYFLGRERYWDGGAWTEDCRSAETKEAQPSAKPRAPKNPEAATPSATAAKAAAKSAAAGAATATRVDTTPAPTPPTPDAAPAPEPRKEAAASAAAAAAGGRYRAPGLPSRGGTEEPPAAATEVPFVLEDPPTPQVEAARLRWRRLPALRKTKLRPATTEAVAEDPPTAGRGPPRTSALLRTRHLGPPRKRLPPPDEEAKAPNLRRRTRWPTRTKATTNQRPAWSPRAGGAHCSSVPQPWSCS